MKVYQTKISKLRGTDFHEVRGRAFDIYQQIKKRSKRKPYIRSLYFNKEKVFLDLFWAYLFEKKHFANLMRRMKFYPCALDLIQNSNFEPISKENPNKRSEILHRFAGMTSEKDLFFVQIKENKQNGAKWFMSVFPVDDR